MNPQVLADIRAAARPQPPGEVNYAPGCRAAAIEHGVAVFRHGLLLTARQDELWREYAIGFARGSAHL